MATYAIGDVQGCFASLQGLLQHIQFKPDEDQLWFAGDLVNRGPNSLATLRFIHQLGERAIVVLGNHDLHLLALHHDLRSAYPDDTLQDILNAPDRSTLMAWLQSRPFIHHAMGYTLVHAGVAPQWTLPQALSLAQEVHQVLVGNDALTFLSHMYGNHPDHWREDLQGTDRLRVITNYLTRMRFCSASGALLMDYKGKPENAPAGHIPWFQLKDRACTSPLLFGHWSALQGETHVPNTFALDTGAIWGGGLTAFRLEDQKRFVFQSLPK